MRADWSASDTYCCGRAHLAPGREFTIEGERGRFAFVRHVVTVDGREWIDAIGGTSGVTMWRSFRPERIKRVHRVRVLHTNPVMINTEMRREVKRRR